jgi:hypothetical protein
MKGRSTSKRGLRTSFEETESRCVSIVIGVELSSKYAARAWEFKSREVCCFLWMFCYDTLNTAPMGIPCCNLTNKSMIYLFVPMKHEDKANRAQYIVFRSAQNEILLIPHANPHSLPITARRKGISAPTTIPVLLSLTHTTRSIAWLP